MNQIRVSLMSIVRDSGALGEGSEVSGEMLSIFGVHRMCLFAVQFTPKVSGSSHTNKGNHHIEPPELHDGIIPSLASYFFS